MKKKFSIVAFTVFMIIPIATGLLASYLTTGNMSIYDNIIKPPLSPPSIVFPIVWSVLYVLMGISSYLVYQNTERIGPLFTYFLSLFVNFFWSIIFFNWQEFGFAFIWLLLLWFLIILTILDYYKISKPAAILQIPYLIWVTFAGYLNFMIWLLNK